jgi:hypothetical protein
MDTKDLGFLKWLIAKGLIPDPSCIFVALRNGNIPVVDYLHEEHKMELEPAECWASFQTTNIDTAKYLLVKKVEMQHEEIWKYLMPQDFESYEPVLNYLYENGLKSSRKTALETAEKKSFQLLEWLHRHGCDFGDVTDLAREINPRACVNPYFDTEPKPERSSFPTFYHANAPLNPLFGHTMNLFEGEDVPTLVTKDLEILKWLKEISTSL